MKKVVITCSKCGKKLEDNDKSFYQAATDAGWKYSQAKVICPDCSGGKTVKDKIKDNAKKDYKKRYEENSDSI